MSLLTPAHLHHFFNNKEMNNFYISIAITTFAEGLISIFVPIYLYDLNYSISAIIWFYLLGSIYFVLISYFSAKIVAKIGIKKAMLLSAPFLIIYYLGLRKIPTAPMLFYILPLFLALRTSLYNYSYHLNYIMHSERKKRGREVSFIGSLGVLMTVLAPMVGAIITTMLGFSALYIIGSAILLLGLLPLSFAQDSPPVMQFTLSRLWKNIISAPDKGLFLSFSCYAIESSIGRIIWPIFLITTLVSIEKTGFIVTLSMVITVVTFYVIGKITDHYDQIKLLRWGSVLYFFAWMGRIFADSSLKVLLIDSYKNISERVLHIPWVTYSYNIAAQRDTFQYIVSREVIFNLTRIIFLPLFMLLFYVDYFPFVITFAVAAILSIGYVFVDLHRNLYK